MDDAEIVERLPTPYRDLLARANGYVAFHGGLHVRGACREPEWHSLRAAWLGPRALHRLFPALSPADVPFGEDALGDQYVLRDGVVHRLEGETGALQTLGVDLPDFDAAARRDPVGFLHLEPLERFRANGGVLEPGQLLSAYPPFCLKADSGEVSLKAVPTADRLRFLAGLAAQLRDLPEGTPAELRIQPWCTTV
jgi:hypothetical protein